MTGSPSPAAVRAGGPDVADGIVPSRSGALQRTVRP
jgi:hypothetical protein